MHDINRQRPLAQRRQGAHIAQHRDQRQRAGQADQVEHGPVGNGVARGVGHVVEDAGALVHRLRRAQDADKPEAVHRRKGKPRQQPQRRQPAGGAEPAVDLVPEQHARRKKREKAQHTVERPGPLHKAGGQAYGGGRRKARHPAGQAQFIPQQRQHGHRQLPKDQRVKIPHMPPGHQQRRQRAAGGGQVLGQHRGAEGDQKRLAGKVKPDLLQDQLFPVEFGHQAAAQAEQRHVEQIHALKGAVEQGRRAPVILLKMAPHHQDDAQPLHRVHIDAAGRLAGGRDGLCLRHIGSFLCCFRSFCVSVRGRAARPRGSAPPGRSPLWQERPRPPPP